MAQTRGSVRLFRLFGIDVSLHWSWLLVAVIEIVVRKRDYTSQVWNVLEYLSLFGLVLLHEFGHSLACRSVGGQANQILLWPFGGVALVNPPPRPGPWLWSVAAGPLVNVVLGPVTIGLYLLASAAHPDASDPIRFLRAVMIMNIGLLVFNLFPVYPLDGGKILQSLIWFVVGRARSLQIVSVIGFVGSLGLVGLAVASGQIWTGLIALFMLSQSANAWRVSGAMVKAEHLPRRPGLRCPACKIGPPLGALWRCACGAPIDLFDAAGACPSCQRHHTKIPCIHCGTVSTARAWGADESG